MIAPEKVIRTNSENQPPFTIVLIKPSGLRTWVGGYKLHDLIEGLLVSAGLRIEQQNTKQLTETDLRRMYPKLNIPDPVWGEQWKIDLIKEMTSLPVIFYIVSGEEAERRAKLIRDHIRSILVDPNGSFQNRKVENMMHVVDSKDFSESSCTSSDTCWTP